MRPLILATLCISLAVLNHSALAAQRSSGSIDERTVADFFRGKVVRIVVGFPPGGGADVYIFLSDADKGKLEITPIYGETISRIVTDFLAMPPAIKERLKRAIKPRH